MFKIPTNYENEPIQAKSNHIIAFEKQILLVNLTITFGGVKLMKSIKDEKYKQYSISYSVFLLFHVWITLSYFLFCLYNNLLC